jgi:hypothetical protein
MTNRLQMEIKAMRYILPIALCICFSQPMAMAEDFILFRDIEASNGPLVKIKADGTGRQIVENDVEDFTVSPDQKFLVVFKRGCELKNICASIIYDLVDGRKNILQIPHVQWRDSWWSTDGVTLNFYREVRVDNGGPACGEGDDYKGCAARARLEAGTFSVLTGKFEIKKDFGVGQFAKLAKFEKENRVVILEAASKDKTQSLHWKKDIDAFVKVWIKDNASGVERLVFEKKRGDFTPGIAVNRHAWSPDGNHFVVNYIRGGIFTKWAIYTIDTHILERKKIAKGHDPHWIINGHLQNKASPAFGS